MRLVPGQEFGDALADVLSGDIEPGGRLPVTWPADEADVPVREVVPTDGRLGYAKGFTSGTARGCGAGRARLRLRTRPRLHRVFVVRAASTEVPLTATGRSPSRSPTRVDARGSACCSSTSSDSGHPRSSDHAAGWPDSRPSTSMPAARSASSWSCRGAARTLDGQRLERGGPDLRADRRSVVQRRPRAGHDQCGYWPGRRPIGIPRADGGRRMSEPVQWTEAMVTPFVDLVAAVFVERSSSRSVIVESPRHPACQQPRRARSVHRWRASITRGPGPRLECVRVAASLPLPRRHRARPGPVRRRGWWGTAGRAAAWVPRRPGASTATGSGWSRGRRSTRRRPPPGRRHGPSWTAGPSDTLAEQPLRRTRKSSGRRTSKWHEVDGRPDSLPGRGPCVQPLGARTGDRAAVVRHEPRRPERIWDSPSGRAGRLGQNLVGVGAFHRPRPAGQRDPGSGTPRSSRTAGSASGRFATRRPLTGSCSA